MDAVRADIVFRSRRVVTPEGVRSASVHVRDGIIERLGDFLDAPAGVPLIDAGDDMLLPGLVDTHVHIDEPGRTEWEGFESATLAAAAGGITTLVDMPLNCVPTTTTVVALDAKRRAGRPRVDVAFWGGVVPGNERDIVPLRNAGVPGYKCFLVPTSTPEFGHVGEAELRRVLPMLAELGVPLLVHAELPGPIEAARPAPDADRRRYATYLASRPPAAEIEAVELLITLCRETGARIHIVHVSAAEVIPLLRAARAEGLPITAETCPHYLHFAAEDVPDGATEFKCAPPIRSRENRERLWQALADGDIDMIVSDHSPCPPAMKLRDTGDFLDAWGGISSLQLGLSVVWAGARARGHGIEDVVRWMAAGPARLAGLQDGKGAIAPRHIADFVVWNPDATWTVEPERLHHRQPITPYAGETLPGVVEATYLHGQTIYERGQPIGSCSGRELIYASWTEIVDSREPGLPSESK
jgi:allantoinase